MGTRTASQILDCPIRCREVMINYTVSGNWFNREYRIDSCPAMYDAGPRCDRRCADQLSQPRGYRISGLYMQ